MLARIVAVVAAVAALSSPVAGVAAEQLQACSHRAPVAAAGVDATTGSSLLCEGSFTCDTDDPCDLAFTGRLYGIGTIEFEHTAIPGSGCAERGSQAHCTASTVTRLQPGASITWACAARAGTIAARVELDCTAAHLNP